MVMQTEVNKIKDRFNDYYLNCDDWSIGDIEFRLRLDFSGKTSMNEKELDQVIDQFCWGSKAT